MLLGLTHLDEDNPKKEVLSMTLVNFTGNTEGLFNSLFFTDSQLVLGHQNCSQNPR